MKPVFFKCPNVVANLDFITISGGYGMHQCTGSGKDTQNVITVASGVG